MRFAKLGVCLVVVCACTSASQATNPIVATTSVPKPTRVVTQRQPDCGTIDIGGPRYQTHLRPTSVEPGDTVTVSGPTYRTEGGRFARSSRVEVWWNTLIPNPTARGSNPVVEGSPVFRLATVRNMDRCRFHVTFTVPDVRPGVFPVRAFVFHRGGYGLFAWQRITVG
jgi:hypothetical protein